MDEDNLKIIKYHLIVCYFENILSIDCFLENGLTGAILECNQRIITITNMLVLDSLASPQTIAMVVFFALKY